MTVILVMYLVFALIHNKNKQDPIHVRIAIIVGVVYLFIKYVL